MILFTDTETSGMIDFRAPVDHPSQPRIVQLAAVLCRDDEECEIVEKLCAVIKPDGWSVQEEAVKVHGITTDYAFKFGEQVEDVMRRFYDLIGECVEDSSWYHGGASTGRLVGHNLPFDIRMLLREAYLLRNFDATFVNKLIPFCTMRAMTPHCRLPHPTRIREFKWPKLIEAYRLMFDTDVLPGGAAHTALADTLACRDIFVEGRKRGWWK